MTLASCLGGTAAAAAAWASAAVVVSNRQREYQLWGGAGGSIYMQTMSCASDILNVPACAQWRRSRREGVKLDGCWAPAWRRCSLRICAQHTQALKKALGAETRVGLLNTGKAGTWPARVAVPVLLCLAEAFSHACSEWRVTSPAAPCVTTPAADAHACMPVLRKH